MQIKDYKVVCGDVHTDLVLDCCDDLDNIIVTLIAAAGIKGSEKQDIMGMSRLQNRIDHAKELLDNYQKRVEDDFENKVWK